MSPPSRVTTPQAIETLIDPYAGTTSTARQFLDAVRAFQQSQDPENVRLRKAASDALDKLSYEHRFA